MEEARLLTADVADCLAVVAIFVYRRAVCGSVGFDVGVVDGVREGCSRSEELCARGRESVCTRCMFCFGSDMLDFRVRV